ncbi:hypothetical protein ARMGADRAFT_972065 [Armillaria gallica]|uniref:Heterokaryon incompatibility domain-containing protein n=1 Tax=Armillaria gallica TaxID=47427 RepID=A0A2H3CW60_ARMGA|nr:hypothetical protein ARMGADRAFT_972065 [Armillaria gallica]
MSDSNKDDTGSKREEREVADPVTHPPLLLHDNTTLDLHQVSYPSSDLPVGQMDVTVVRDEVRHRRFQYSDSQGKRKSRAFITSAVTAGAGGAASLALSWMFRTFVSSSEVLNLGLEGAACCAIGLVAGGAVLYCGKQDEQPFIDDGNDSRPEPFTGPKTAAWRNSFLGSLWPIINSGTLFTSVSNILEGALQAALPKHIHGARVADIGQGSEPLRVLGVPPLHADETIGTKSEDGDFVNPELAVASEARSAGQDAELTGRSRNAHLQLVPDVTIDKEDTGKPTTDDAVDETDRRSSIDSTPNDSDHISPEDSQPSETLWKNSMSHVATIDQNSDVSQLRWVGTEFVFFLDIPWDHQFENNGTETTGSGSSAEAGGVPLGFSIRSTTIGLLENIINSVIPDDILLSSDRKYVSGDHLTRLIVPWTRDLLNDVRTSNAPSDSLLSHRGKYCWNLLREVTAELDDVVYSSSDTLVIGEGKTTLGDVLCAVTIMLATLEGCLRAIWSFEDSENIVERTRMFGEVTQLIRYQFSKSWGNKAFSEMERVFSGGLAFSAYAMTCKPIPSDSVDPKTYKPKHVTPSCSCEYLKPSLDSICRFLDDKIPPVVFFDDSDLHVRSASDTPYVAISHVWADGLGSTTEEGLPRCQVERLAGLASKLVPGGAFWQDGLCIPKEQVHRNRAITLMTETYTDADKVLVLDGGLRTACKVSSPKEECLLRIATSGWLQRIWTLQEGMLGHELHFEVMDGIIDCTHFNGDSFVMARRVFPLLAYREGDPSLLTYKHRLETPPKCDVNDLIGLLRYRTTSKPRDEPVAVSGLLRINTGQLVNISLGPERMKDLFIQARELPRQLAVFGWMAPRLSLPNFRWAPTSLSSILWPGPSDDARTCICTEDGLFGEFTVVRFQEPVLVLDPVGILLIIEDSKPGGNTHRVFNLVLSPPFCREKYGEWPHCWHVGGFIMKGETIVESMREEAVGAVVFPSDVPDVPHPVHNYMTQTCEFVAPASFRFGVPDKVVTSRTRQFWSFVYATVEPLAKVRLT